MVNSLFPRPILLLIAGVAAHASVVCADSAAGVGKLCGDRQQRCTIYPAGIRRRTFWERSAARCVEIFHRAAGWNRPRQIEQTEQQHSCEISALWYFDMVEAQYWLLTEGLGVNHARLVMGRSMGGMLTWFVERIASRFHGRADAAGEFARSDFRTEPILASDRHPGDQQ
jgi:hypothetical protein